MLGEGSMGVHTTTVSNPSDDFLDLLEDYKVERV